MKFSFLLDEIVHSALVPKYVPFPERFPPRVPAQPSRTQDWRYQVEPPFQDGAWNWTQGVPLDLNTSHFNGVFIHSASTFSPGQVNNFFYDPAPSRL